MVSSAGVLARKSSEFGFGCVRAFESFPVLGLVKMCMVVIVVGGAISVANGMYMASLGVAREATEVAKEAVYDSVYRQVIKYVGTAIAARFGGGRVAGVFYLTASGVPDVPLVPPSASIPLSPPLLSLQYFAQIRDAWTQA